MNVLKKISFFFLCFVLTVIVTSSLGRTQTGSGQNHVVSLSTAVKYITNFRSSPSIPQIKGGLFNRNVIDQILQQPDCAAIRYYYAKDDNGNATIVVVGVNSQGNDLENGIIAENILPCPPVCGNQSSLNK